MSSSIAIVVRRNFHQVLQFLSGIVIVTKHCDCCLALWLPFVILFAVRVLYLAKLHWYSLPDWVEHNLYFSSTYSVADYLGLSLPSYHGKFSCPSFILSLLIHLIILVTSLHLTGVSSMAQEVSITSGISSQYLIAIILASFHHQCPFENFSDLVVYHLLLVWM